MEIIVESGCSCTSVERPWHFAANRASWGLHMSIAFKCVTGVQGSQVVEHMLKERLNKN